MNDKSEQLETKVTTGEKNLACFKWKVLSAPTLNHVKAIDCTMEIAARTWKSIVPISVVFDFEDPLFQLEYARKTILGNCATRGNVRVGEFYYTDAVARTINGNTHPSILPLGISNGDMIVSLNPNMSWYTGIEEDGNLGDHDLIGTCLHEIIHGLGFTSHGFRVVQHLNTTFAWVENRSDRFLAFVTTLTPDGKNVPISDYYENPENLGYALTSNNLYFSTADGVIAKLFAPKIYSLITSVIHLDEETYSGSENSLMTPTASMHDKCDKCRDVGPITRKILEIIRDPSAKPPTSFRFRA